MRSHPLLALRLVVADPVARGPQLVLGALGEAERDDLVRVAHAPEDVGLLELLRPFVRLPGPAPRLVAPRLELADGQRCVHSPLLSVDACNPSRGL